MKTSHFKASTIYKQIEYNNDKGGKKQMYCIESKRQNNHTVHVGESTVYLDSLFVQCFPVDTEETMPNQHTVHYTLLSVCFVNQFVF